MYDNIRTQSAKHDTYTLSTKILPGMYVRIHDIIRISPSLLFTVLLQLGSCLSLLSSVTGCDFPPPPKHWSGYSAWAHREKTTWIVATQATKHDRYTPPRKRAVIFCILGSRTGTVQNGDFKREVAGIFDSHIKRKPKTCISLSWTHKTKHDRYASSEQVTPRTQWNPKRVLAWRVFTFARFRGRKKRGGLWRRKVALLLVFLRFQRPMMTIHNSKPRGPPV